VWSHLPVDHSADSAIRLDGDHLMQLPLAGLGLEQPADGGGWGLGGHERGLRVVQFSGAHYEEAGNRVLLSAAKTALRLCLQFCISFAP
jgi:hypothetical protein